MRKTSDARAKPPTRIYRRIARRGEDQLLAPFRSGRLLSLLERLFGVIRESPDEQLAVRRHLAVLGQLCRRRDD